MHFLPLTSKGLVLLDGLKKRLEIPGTEAVVIVTLDQLNEERGPILQRFGEELKKVAIVVVINKNLVGLDTIHVFLHFDLGMLQALA